VEGDLRRTATPDQGCGNPVKWLLKLSGDQVVIDW
jgi:hypothetical protein